MANGSAATPITSTNERTTMPDDNSRFTGMLPSVLAGDVKAWDLLIAWTIHRLIKSGQITLPTSPASDPPGGTS
jgi:hypothetical protein